jgi:methionyl-tRNA formyltransferase
MTAQIDQGPILRQAPLPLAADAGYLEINRAVGQLGARLFLDYVQSAPGQSEETEQNSNGSHQGFPTADDFLITPDWDVERAYRFIKGVKALTKPRIIDSSGDRLRVNDVLSRHTGQAPTVRTLDKDIRVLELNDGWIRLRIE